MAVKITKEQLAAYIQSIYESKKFQELMLSQKNLGLVKQRSNMIAHFCALYFLSTGDSSPEAIERALALIEEYLEEEEEKERADQLRMDALTFNVNVFAETVGGLIIDYHSHALGCNPILTTGDMLKVLNAINEQAKSSNFKTHAFSGALYDAVNKEGLDVSHEMFKNELDLLGAIGISAPFSADSLMTCELSEQTFENCHVAPERIDMMFAPQGAQKDDEPRGEFLKRGLRDKVKAAKVSEDQKQQYIDAGDKIIDFYSQPTSSCIAIIDGKPSPIIDRTKSMLIYLTTLPEKVKAYAPAEMQHEMDEANRAVNDRNLSDEERLSRVAQYIDKWRSTEGPLSEVVRNAKEEAFYKTLSHHCLETLDLSNAAGEPVQGGKINREEMAIANIQDPCKYYPVYRREQAKTAAKGAKNPSKKAAQLEETK